MPVAKEITDKPIVIGMVYDPIKAKLIKDWAHPDTNVTGGSNFVSLPVFMRRLVKRCEGSYPIKKVAIIFTPGEPNSELQAAAVKSIENELGLEIASVPLANSEDVTKWANSLSHSKTDLVFVTGSNIISTNLPVIITATSKAKVWTATHLDDLVERGVLLGLVAEPSDVGTLAGKALSRVLAGTSPAQIPVEYPLPKMMINKSTAEGGKFAIPPSISQWAQ